MASALVLVLTPLHSVFFRFSPQLYHRARQISPFFPKWLLVTVFITVIEKADEYKTLKVSIYPENVEALKLAQSGQTAHNIHCIFYTQWVLFTQAGNSVWLLQKCIRYSVQSGSLKGYSESRVPQILI